MCGIAGIIGNEPTGLESMLEITARRGPEGTSTKNIENGVLGHNLLAFVEVGNNPQPYTEEGDTIAFNGELYNWKELNQELNLEAENDTQVLLRGLKKEGVSFLKRIDGQFAYVAEIDGNVEVGRDKWGISPLVFAEQENQVYIASTTEALRNVGLTEIRTVPAGTRGRIIEGDLELNTWFTLPKVAIEDQKYISPEEIFQEAVASVEARIPDEQEILYTAMGGIDSQFVTVATARATKGNFGGAITVVPWDPKNPEKMDGGDYYEAKASIDMLRREGINVKHYVVQLSPEYIDEALDRVLAVLGPDYFNVNCGLAEDLVATTAKANGGKAIMTAGGPDEAGRSYVPWTKRYKDNIEEGFYSIADQFASSEGVRAGLIFGEQGLENRVPLAFLIEKMSYAIPEQKQVVEDWSEENFSMRDKIAWREALEGYLPQKSLNKPKETIHGASGAKEALYHLAINDSTYNAERESFIQDAMEKGWQLMVHSDMSDLDKNNKITEGQVYTLWRWSKLDSEMYSAGAEGRYGDSSPVFSDELTDKIRRPVCYDWQPIM